MRPPITKNIGKELVPPSILPRADVPLTIDATVDKDLGIVQDRLINIKDTRKVRRTTGQPLKPTERRAGNIPEGLIKDIVGYAKNYGINPYEAISRAIIESEGNPTYNNPFHLLYNPESNPAISKIKDSYRSGVEAGIVALKQKEKEFKNLVKRGKIAPRPPDKMEMLKLQMYNGLGRIFPDTEGATGWMYGIKIPKEGIKMTENPLYAKELLDIMDVVKLNPNVKTIVEQAKPITKTTQYGPLKNQDYENYFTGPEFFASGGPVYNWIPPNYPRVGARNEQGGWLDQYADGGDTNPLMNIPESQRFPPTLQRTVTYPEGFIENKLNPGVPLNFMGQPFATGAIEESMSPLDLIGGVRGGMGLIKGAMKYKQAMKPNYIQIGDKLFNMGPHPRAVRRATKQMHKGVRDIVLPSAFENGGDVPHDYMYSQGNVSSYRPGTSIHPIGMTNVPDSPCGPGFTIQYDETGNPVCMPIAELAPSDPTVLAGANQMDYDLFNLAVYNQSPLETYSVERTTRGRNKEERFKPTREEKQATRKAIKASSLHRRPFLFGIRQGFKKVGDAIQRCLPGDDCYKFEDGSWVTDSSIPTPTTPSYYPDYPDRTLTNYQMGTPKAPMYAYGATVFTKQTTPTWVAGTPTRTTTQRITPQRAQSPGTQVPYPEIKITGPTDPYSPSSPPVLQGYNPYKGPMRLHAPDTTMIARNGGYVPMYKKGGFLSTLGDVGLAIGDTALGAVGSVTGIKSMQDMIDEDQYSNDKFDDVGNFTGKVAGTALKVIPVTAPFAAAAGAVGTVANKALKIDEKNYDPTQHTSSWDKWGSGIESVGSIASMAMGNVSGAAGGAAGAAGAATKISKAAEVANTIGKGANLVNAGMGVVQGLGQGQLDFNSLMNLYGGIQGLQGGSSGIPSITQARHGGHITSKYNPPGLRWQQLNPGVSAPEGVYTGPTSQRGITFADGGDVEVLELKPSISGGASSFWQKGAYELPMMGGNISGNFGGKYNPYLKGYAGLGNTRSGIISGEAGVSPHIKAGKFIINPSATMGLTGGIKRRQDIYTTDPSGNITQQTTDPTLAGNIYSKAKLKALYTDVSKDLNFKPYMSAEVTKDPYGTRLPISAGLDFGRDTFVQGSYDPLSNTFGVGAQFNFGGEKNPYKYKAKRKVPTSRYNPTFADGGDVPPFITSNRAEYEERLKALNDSTANYLKDKYQYEVSNNYTSNSSSPYDEIVRLVDMNEKTYGYRSSGYSPKPKQKVIFNPDIPKMPMRSASLVDINIPEPEVKGRPTYRNWNTGEVMYDIPEHLKIGSNWRSPEKKANRGWLDSYEEGGDVEEKEVSNKKQNIVNLQTKLKQAGIYKGVIDGIYGPNTEKAHVAYNKKNVENKASIFPTDFTRNVMTKLLPLNAGVFLGDLIGATGDITESNLKDSELEALQNIVRTNLKKGKPYIEYEDYNTGSKYGDVSKGNFSVKRVGKAIQKEFNPNYNLKTTLGQANIITTPTDTFVVDQYNFNNKDLVTLKDVASEGLSNLDPYTGMRNIGALYGSGPGQGSKVKIKTTQKSNTSGWLDFFD